MTANRTDHQQADDDLPYGLSKTKHRKILDDLLDTVRKQEDIMGQLLRDLEFFRKKFKTSLEYDSGGAEDYCEEMGDGTEYDVRSYTDAGDGIIKEETTVNYIGYKIAMDNFQMGLNKTKDQIEKIWKDVDVGKGSLALPKWEADSLEKGRKAAAQD